MSVFIRRFLADPGNEVLLDIESVNVLDLDPPASISGIGTGTVLCVGEYEDGPFNTPTEVTGTSDFTVSFGKLGYDYAGVPGNNASARGRKADGTIVEENWNGNAFVQLNAKKFKRLVCVRADTSVGTVELRRQAYVTGAASFSYNMEPSQILAFDIGAGPVSATFTATAATTNSGSGTYPTLFTGGETLTLGYDSAANFVVTFLAADQTKAQVIARINTFAGFSFASDGGGTVITFTGIKRGTSGQVRIVSGTASVLTALSLVAATTVNGTGNVSDIDAVAFTEIKSVVETAISGTSVEQDSSGRLRVSKVYATATDYISVGAATTATALGFTVAQMNSNDGFARLRSTTQTMPITVTAVLTLGVDNESNFNVTLTSGFTQAQVITAINTAVGFTMASSVSGTIMLLTGRLNGGQVRVINATNATLLSDLGLVAGTTIVAAGIVAGSVPAGTPLQNSANTRNFVTMQTVSVTIAAVNGAGGVGPYTVKVRHALDDGTGLSATAGTIAIISAAADVGSFSVVNPALLTAALTESAIDAVYNDAFDSTLNLNSVAREANIMFSARQSNQVRKKLKANVIEASAIGMFGRVGCVRPPLGISKTVALSKTAEPGVGAYRDQRVIYCFPGANAFVPIIARRGTAGGKGFNATGNIDCGADGFMASVLSQLPPEENPGQVTSFMSEVNGLETSASVSNLTIDDYKLFKLNGIAALRMDEGVAIFQSGVTSVDPTIYPNLKNIARRRMADFIQDTLARRGKAFGKKLSTFARRKALALEMREFLEGLLSKNNLAFQRIAGFTIDDKTGNTPTTLAQGIFRLIIKVKTLASLDSIVLETTIGESVQVEEELPQAA